ncbi:hypothetical protein [Geomicrobium sediminis]|uniref:Cobalamin biosynthesis Mg chelatase CobN n=1 Tax=Geomicrobium sediminis TaxID=1347788 RepID=A0ABS2PE08_9BACL|nr:hypothetical protein [Geomicrobium sediminis]MBM7633566.1 cobalamin biosynthesis Mg chelatase CobN [Geomicrobium sediminis]
MGTKYRSKEMSQRQDKDESAATLASTPSRVQTYGRKRREQRAGEQESVAPTKESKKRKRQTKSPILIQVLTIVFVALVIFILSTAI